MPSTVSALGKRPCCNTLRNWVEGQSTPFCDTQPEVIASANIGCITHLQSGTATPVRHWIEILDDSMQY